MKKMKLLLLMTFVSVFGIQSTMKTAFAVPHTYCPATNTCYCDLNGDGFYEECPLSYCGVGLSSSGIDKDFIRNDRGWNYDEIYGEPGGLGASKEFGTEDLLAQYGSPSNMPPDVYAKYLLMTQPDIMDENDMEEFNRKVDEHMAQWMLKEYGSPSNMPPDVYAKYLLVTQPNIMDENDMRKFEQKLVDHIVKWEQKKLKH